MVHIDNAWIFMFSCIDKLSNSLEDFWVFIYFVKLLISLLERKNTFFGINKIALAFTPFS